MPSVGPARPLCLAMSLWLAAACPAAASPPAAAPPASAAEAMLALGERHALPSTALAETRPFLVRLPRSYGQGDQRYPVLYVLDAETQFLHLAGIADFLAANLRIPEMIVVAVPNTHRSRDLTPPTEVEEEKTGHGQSATSAAEGAGDFLRFLADELRPWVDRNLRTEDFRILVGHSLGGLFSWYALTQRPEAFQAHITVSPSLWWNRQQLLPAADPGLAQRLHDLSGPHFLYLTWGDREPRIEPPTRALAEWLRTSAPPALHWEARHYPGEDHGTNPHRSVYDGLQWIFEGWRMPGEADYWRLPGGEGPEMNLAAVQAHYDALSRKYGYAVRPSPYAIERVGRQLLGSGRLEEAIALFERNADNHPALPQLAATLGEALEAAARPAQAAAAYDRAMRLALARGPADADLAERYRLAAERNRRAEVPEN